MDKNTIAGLVIIFLILIGFSYLTRPSKEQVAEMQRKQDSIARVDRLRAQELAAQQQAQKTPDNTTAANPLATKSDSGMILMLFYFRTKRYGKQNHHPGK